jgi:hypothetical protein
VESEATAQGCSSNCLWAACLHSHLEQGALQPVQWFSSAVSFQLVPARAATGLHNSHLHSPSACFVQPFPSCTPFNPTHCALCMLPAYRTTLSLLGGDGYTAYAPDWPGHGDSDKPSPGAFGYKEADYLKALETFVDACGIRKPFALVVQVGGHPWEVAEQQGVCFCLQLLLWCCAMHPLPVLCTRAHPRLWCWSRLSAGGQQSPGEAAGRLAFCPACLQLPLCAATQPIPAQ